MCLVAFFFVSHYFKLSCILASFFSSGSLISIRRVSMIPKKVRKVVGPSIFSEASGIPRSEHNWMKVSRLCWQIDDCGGPRCKKSSR